jgi:hypothetical protein
MEGKTPAMKRTVVVECSWQRMQPEGSPEYYICQDDPRYVIYSRMWETPTGDGVARGREYRATYLRRTGGPFPLGNWGNGEAGLEGAKRDCYNHMTPWPPGFAYVR